MGEGSGMSASRCLGPAVDALSGVPREQWSAYLDALPVTCPHADCTAKPGCRAYVTDYFRVQWRIRAAREARAGGSTQEALAHG